jgi:hypothetical protein
VAEMMKEELEKKAVDSDELEATGLLGKTGMSKRERTDLCSFFSRSSSSSSLLAFGGMTTKGRGKGRSFLGRLVIRLARLLALAPTDKLLALIKF